MTLWLSVAGQTDIGRQRERNEDRFYYRVVQSSDQGALGLFVVADGMGGHPAGQVASQWAVEALKRELAPLFHPRDVSATRRLDAEALAAVGTGVTVRLDEADMARLLAHAVQRANQVVLGYARSHSHEAADMGTTLTLAVVADDRVTVAHVGDSRAYLWREGELQQLTEDHSVPGALLKQGRIQAAEVYDHPHRNLLYRSLGLQPTVPVDVYPATVLHPGEVLLLCSDGLWDMVHPAARLAGLVDVQSPPGAICRRLVAAANEAGGEDNITVVVVRGEPLDG